MTNDAHRHTRRSGRAACFSASALAATACILGSTLAAEGFGIDAGGGERLQLASEVSAIAAGAAGRACRDEMPDLPASGDKETQRAADILEALLNGQDDWGVRGAERRAQTLQAIAATEAATAKLRQMPDDAPLTEIVQGGRDMRGAAEQLVTELIGQYTQPAALLNTDALLINLSARQMTLAAAIRSAACLVQIGDEEFAPDLAEARDLHARSLAGLMEGVPMLGVLPPPNAEIAALLDAAAGLWADILPAVEQLATGAALTSGEFVALEIKAAELQEIWSQTVTAYVAQSKLNL